MDGENMRIRILALVCLSALALAGCTDSKADDSSPPNAASSAPDTASDPGAPPAPQAGAVSATKLCDHLREELPKLTSVGSKVGAMAQLAVDLAGWFDQQGAKPADGSELDELTSKECPQVRSDVLAAIGKGSFSEL
jgi:hypothetical protein